MIAIIKYVFLVVLRENILLVQIVLIVRLHVRSVQELRVLARIA